MLSATETNQSDIGTFKFFSRKSLEEIFPHRGVALIADYGTIDGDVYSLALEPSRFCQYTNGHSWFFPMHWLIEMSALTAGFAAIHELQKRLGPDAMQFNIPSFHQPGAWSGEQLSPKLTSLNPIWSSCSLEDLELKIGQCRVKVTATVQMSQGDKQSILVGIKGSVIKGDVIRRLTSES